VQPGQIAPALIDKKTMRAYLWIASWREIFGVDLRTLAAFRILLGGFLLLDLCLRSRDLSAHYTDFGIFPRAVAVEGLATGAFSLHLMNGSAFFQAALFVLAGVFAALMIIGWRTRFVTIVSWFLLLSLQNRNWEIHSGEDQLAMVLMFWAMFLPLGARFSVDSALDRAVSKQPNAFVSLASAALLLQGMSMYLFSALLKTDARWVPDGTAVYYALQLDYFATSLALWFRQFEMLLHGLTYYVWTLELIGPILIFSPLLHRPLRVMLMAAFITMHCGFFLFLEIGIFPLISIIMNLTFMPGWMWDWFGQKLRPETRHGLHIWYDDGCEFCLKTCLLLRVFLVLPGVGIAPAQSNPRARELLEAHNSWVVTQGAASFVRWDAMRHLFVCSPVFWPLAKILSLQPIRIMGDRLYLWIASNRSKLGAMTARILPWRDIQIRPTPWQTLIVAAAMALVFAQNISTQPRSGFQLPQPAKQVRQFLGLYQNWTMFAPFPELISPWPIIMGKLKDGRVVDVYNVKEGIPSFEKPELVSAVYTNYRWRKYLSNLEDASYENERNLKALNYGRYLCRAWNTGTVDADKLSTFTIYFNVEWTPPPGRPKEVKTREVWSHDCFS
jgi:predicted DCC family thiol-disulfide oxidoreductase YuxK